MDECSSNDIRCIEVALALASELLYVEPDEDRLAVQVQERVFSETPFGGDDEEMQAGLGLLDGWCGKVSSQTPEEFAEAVGALRREWLSLFVGVGLPLASCQESYYTEPDSRLFGRGVLEVRRAYRSHGLQIERLHAEPDDHLGLMLGFLSVLAGEEAQALDEGHEERARALADEQRVFLAAHILPWLAVWQDLVEKHAASDYYRGVGHLVLGLCCAYAERFGIAFNREERFFISDTK